MSLASSRKMSGPHASGPGALDPLARGLPLIVILFGLLVAYAPALNGGILWDDDGHLCRPGLRTLRGLWRIWSDLGSTQQYYPVLHSAFWVEYKLWGDHLRGYHLMNVLLHGASSFLVVCIVRRLLLPGAFLAGIIFALHPVGVESVAWISEQKNTLSTVFYLGSVLSYLRFEDKRRPAWHLLAFSLFVLAVLTKSVTATLPIVLLVINWWKRGKLDWKNDVVPLLPWIVLGGCSGLLTAWVESWIVGAGDTFSLSFLQKFLLAGRILYFYLGKLFWPANLAFVYPRWTISTESGWQYLFPVGSMAVFVALWTTRKKNRSPLAAGLIYICSLLPVLGFLAVYPFIFSYVADHFQYLASIAVFIAVAALIARLISRLPVAVQASVAWGVVVVISATLGRLTWRQAHQYRDAGTLYRATLALNPECWMANNNLGKILAANPATVSEAIDHFEAALRSNPSQADAHFNLANALAQFPLKRQAALAHYEASLSLKFDQADTHNNYGVLLASDPRQRTEAAHQFEIASAIDPNLVDAHTNLGALWSRIPGHQEEALAQFQAAAKLNPAAARVHFDLGNALAKNSSTKPQAIEEYLIALKIDPSLAEAHLNLATVFQTTPGHEQEAIDHYQAALKLRPEWDVVRDKLNALTGSPKS